MPGQSLKKLILLLPRDGAGRARRLGEHRDDRRETLKPWPAIVIAVGPRRTIQNGAHDFQAAIDRARTGTFALAVFDERLERAVMDLLRFEIAEVPEEKLHVPRDGIGGTLLLRFSHASRRAMAEQGTRVRFTIEFDLESFDFTLELLFGFL